MLLLLAQTSAGRISDFCLCSLCLLRRLFETHPECKDVFFLFRDVKDLERLRSSQDLRAHGLRSVSSSDNTHTKLASVLL